ncbi:MAG: F0F1 ATP synthase subunit epsilon [Planctomycetota bacterium]|jgi:F-type H+-transporting ATPase subunit epsilon|nr:F0F1 ATP synthase subunit epsilon [Planctomycetota bacterium]
MNLKILLPFKVFADIGDVSNIVVEARSGSYGLLPRRLDCVMTLAPGILAYGVAGGDDAYVAVDEGVLIKTGPEVLVSVRNAIAGGDLVRLREAVEGEFLAMKEEESTMKAVLTRMESDLVQRLAELHHGR